MTRLKQGKDKARQQPRALDRIDTALRSLRPPWKVLRETGIAADRSRLGAAFVALHPERGIALVDLAPARPDAATTWVRVTLLRAGGGVFTVREPPIMSVTLSPEEIPDCVSRIEACFAGLPPCALPDKDWPDVAVATLTAQHAGLVPLRRDGAPQASRQAERRDASQPANFRPAGQDAQPAPKGNVPPSEVSASSPMGARPNSNPPGPRHPLQHGLREERRAEEQHFNRGSRQAPIGHVREQDAAGGSSEPTSRAAERSAPSPKGPQLAVPRIDVPRYATRRNEFAGINVPVPSIGSPVFRASHEESPRKLPEASAVRIDAPAETISAVGTGTQPSVTDASRDAAKPKDAPIEIPPMPPPALEDVKIFSRPSAFAAGASGVRPDHAPTAKAPPKREEIRISRGNAATEPPRMHAPEPPGMHTPHPRLYAERDPDFAPPRRRRQPLWLVGASAVAAAIILFAYPRETTGPEKPTVRTTQAPTQDDAPTVSQFGLPGRGASAPNVDEAFLGQAAPAAPSNQAAPPRAAPQPAPPQRAAPPPPSAETPSLAANSATAPHAAKSKETQKESEKTSKSAVANRTRPTHKRVVASNTPAGADDEAAPRKLAATPKNAPDTVAHRRSGSTSAGKNSETHDAGDQDVVTIQGTDYVAGREPRVLGSISSQTEVASAPAQAPVAEQPVPSAPPPEAQSPQQQKPRNVPLPPNTDFAITPGGIMGPSGVVTPFGER